MNISDKFLVYAGFLYMWFIGKTTRIIFKKPPEYDELRKNNKPVIYASWHGRQIFLIWTHRNQKICLLISKSKDGEYIARITEKLGYELVRGSTSKGGFEALAMMIEKAKAGYALALTPDGPRGPRGVVQQGVIVSAMQSGLPIIPIAAALKRKYIIRNWDEFHIPLPFNKAVVCYGKPLYVRENDSIEQKAAELKKAIDEVTKDADSLI